MRIKMYKSGKQWIFSLLGVATLVAAPFLVENNFLFPYATVHAETTSNSQIKEAPQSILQDTKNLPNINEINANNPLGISSIFSIFSKNASLGADVNGNIATANLKNADRDFGTRANNYNNTNNDLSYIQNIENNRTLNDRAFRANNSVAVLGNSIKVAENSYKQIEINDRRVSTLSTDNTYQDKGTNKYIDFDQYFNDLTSKSSNYMNTSQSAGVETNFQDMNNQSINVSKADQTQKSIYVDIDYSKLSNPQDITIKGLSSKLDGPSIIFNVKNVPYNVPSLQTKINYVYDNGTTVKSNGEDHSMPNHVLWNFGTSANTLNVSGRILGSILAPNATINTTVNIDGNIVASNVNVSGETHRWDLQTPSSETPSKDATISVRSNEKPGNGTDNGNPSSNQPGNPFQPSNATNNGVINTSTNIGSKVNNGAVNSPELPQTGENNRQSQTMSFIGVLLAMFGSLLGFLGIKKRRND